MHRKATGRGLGGWWDIPEKMATIDDTLVGVCESITMRGFPNIYIFSPGDVLLFSQTDACCALPLIPSCQTIKKEDQNLEQIYLDIMDDKSVT